MSDSKLSRRMELLERSQIMINNSILSLVQAMGASVANNTCSINKEPTNTPKINKMTKIKARRIIEQKWNDKYGSD